MREGVQKRRVPTKERAKMTRKIWIRAAAIIAAMVACQGALALMAHGSALDARAGMPRSPSGPMVAIDFLCMLGAAIFSVAGGWRAYVGLSRTSVEPGTAMPWPVVATGLIVCLMAPIFVYGGLGVGGWAVSGDNGGPVWTVFPKAWLGVLALGSGFAASLLAKRAFDVRIDEALWDVAMVSKAIVAALISMTLWAAMILSS
jgi:hypothetical protein